MKDNNTCPNCGADWDGGLILETLVRQRMKECSPPPYRWGSCFGIIAVLVFAIV